jgi:hypothetical protein
MEQARVDKGERLPALVHRVEHKLPVAKDVGRRHALAAVLPLAVVVGALGVRLWNEVIFWRGAWRRWVSDRRQRSGRRRGRVRHLHVAQPAADLLVPRQWSVSLRVLL